MSRSCELILNKKVLVGNNVSHSNRKTKRVFRPNLINVSLLSEKLNKKFNLKIANNTMRTIDKKGGFDQFLVNSSDKNLTNYAITIKKMLKKNLKNNNQL